MQYHAVKEATFSTRRTRVSLRMLQIFCVFILCFTFSCNNHPVKPEPPEIVQWTKVESFQNQPIFSLYVSSDSTEMHVVSQHEYGYLPKGRKAGDFLQKPLAAPISYTHVLPGVPRADYLPYFTDDKCFFGNADGNMITIYNIKGGALEEIGSLNLWDFMADSEEYIDRFTRSYYVNLSNHITWAGGSHYYVTTEQQRTDFWKKGDFEVDGLQHTASKKQSRSETVAPYGAIYKQYLITLNETSPLSYDLIYETDGVYHLTDDTRICSSFYNGEHFLQDIFSNDCHIILSKDSPEYIKGSGPYPIRERFYYMDHMIGIGDGVIMRSYDFGINWEEWLGINGAWIYACISDEHILYNRNNIGHWKLTDSITTVQMLESDALLGLWIHYLKEFDGYVYAATNEGLYKKPVSEFFTNRPETKGSYQAIIE